MSDTAVISLAEQIAVVSVPAVTQVRAGTPGLQGPQGPAGEGEGGEGTPGPAGASAYEVAVENGFVGTESQWLASLVGPQGPQGPQGTQGPAGATGATGATGPQGPQGEPGPAGADGAPGATGPQGEPGPAGADGAPGATGATGPEGPEGPAGADGLSAYEVAVAEGFSGDVSAWLASLVGPQGPQGEQGPQGIQGPQGEQGPAGPAGGGAYINIRDYIGLVSGGSWTAAFNQALIDAVASGTRTIYFPYVVSDNAGNYNFNTKPNVIGAGITLRGENPRQFLVRNYAPTGAAGSVESSFLVWDGSANPADPNQNKGGGIVNLGLGAGNGTSGGAAIQITGTTTYRPGYMDFENVVVSVPNGSTGTWGFGLLIKGQGITTSGSQGIRDVSFRNLYIFRCTGEPIQVTNGVHIFFENLTVVDGGAGNADPGVRINGGGTTLSNSTQVYITNADIEGTLYLVDCSRVVCTGFLNRISTGTSATSCKFIGVVVTNNATTGTVVV